jgi:DNA ligase 1
MNVALLEEVSNVGSKLEKQRLIAGFSKEDVEFLKLALDPAVTFGVTVDEDDGIYRSRCPSEPVSYWGGFGKLLSQLQVRSLTGTAAQVAVRDVLMESPTELDLKWSCRILNRQLRAGFDISTINKVFPKTVVKFAVSLAEPYDPDKHELTGWWFVEPKLDGNRVVLIDGVGYSRNGKTYDTIGHIAKELASLSTAYVFDGELMGSKDFDENSGAARRKGEGDNLDLIFNVFDVVRKDEWAAGKTRTTAERKDDLDVLKDALAIIGKAGKYKPHVKVVEWYTVENPTQQDLRRYCDQYIAQGYEGAMMKRAAAPYVFKRSDNILKVKRFLDADGVVVDLAEGKNSFKGMLGAAWIEVDGVRSKVGSGFDVEQRERFWKNPGLIKGHMIEVQYQNKTPDGKLRFPVFIRLRPDKD